MENLRPACIAKSPEKPPKRSFKPVPRHGKVTGKQPQNCSVPRPGVHSKVARRRSPEKGLESCGKVLDGRGNSLFVRHPLLLHLRTPDCIPRDREFNLRQARMLAKSPESRLRAVQNLFQGTVECIAKSPEGHPEAASKLFQGRPGVHSKVARRPPESNPKAVPSPPERVAKVARAVGKVGPRRSCADTLRVYSYVCVQGFKLCFCLVVSISLI